MKIKVLHITPHISGGVGSVLLSILKFYNKNQYFEHEIIAFEKLLDSEKNMGSRRGLRHLFGLRVRGQRTRTTGRKGRKVVVTKSDMKKTIKVADK